MPYEQDDRHTATHICSPQESGEPRVMARGIHPAILAQGGLAPALKTLARRGTVPVELDAGSRAASQATLRVCGRRLSIFAPNEPGTSPRSALPAPRELQKLILRRLNRKLRSVVLKERSGVGRQLRHRGSPVLLARCHISSIGLASVSPQVCGRHSLAPSDLPAGAGGPGRRGCRTRSRPSAASGPACLRGQQGGADAVGARSPRGHDRFRIGAGEPRGGMTCRFAATQNQHNSGFRGRSTRE
jgi:hypothetical protein